MSNSRFVNNETIDLLEKEIMQLAVDSEHYWRISSENLVYAQTSLLAVTFTTLLWIFFDIRSIEKIFMFAIAANLITPKDLITSFLFMTTVCVAYANFLRIHGDKVGKEPQSREYRRRAESLRARAASSALTLQEASAQAAGPAPVQRVKQTSLEKKANQAHEIATFVDSSMKRATCVYRCTTAFNYAIVFMCLLFEVAAFLLTKCLMETR